MANKESGIPRSLRRSLIGTRPERGPVKFKKRGLFPTDGRIWQAPKGYKSMGVVTVENYILVEDTVPEAVHRRAELKGDVIIKLRSETIVKDGRLVVDRIEAEYFVREFLCC